MSRAYFVKMRLSCLDLFGREDWWPHDEKIFQVQNLKSSDQRSSRECQEGLDGF